MLESRKSDAIIAIVDDDASAREGLQSQPAIAAELNITEPAVKSHGGHVMRRMRADSLAELGADGREPGDPIS